MRIKLLDCKPERPILRPLLQRRGTDNTRGSDHYHYNHNLTFAVDSDCRERSQFQDIDRARIPSTSSSRSWSDCHSKCSANFRFDQIFLNADIPQGKGYPDLNTKQFLRHILDIGSTPLPIFGLFDGDPDGLDIYRCYRVGSKRSTQEASSNLPEMKWLGVDVGDFLKYPGMMSEALSLTTRDRTRARGMLRRKELEIADRRTNSNEDATRWRTSLQRMLMLNVKMEIQAVDKMEGGLCGWLVEKMLAS